MEALAVTSLPLAAPSMEEQNAGHDLMQDESSVDISQMSDEWHLETLAEYIASLPQLEAPVKHSFSPGIYMREIFMPKGSFVVGHKHKTKHQNIVLTGKAIVWFEGQRHEISAPYVVESGAGAQKLLEIHEDMRWITVHANPTDCTDIVKLEEELLDLSPQFLAAKGDKTLDAFRLSMTQNTLADLKS